MVPDPPELLTAIERLGGTIVDNDLAVASRSHDVDVSEEDDPEEALVDQYFRRVPCPTIHNDKHDRAAYLIGRVKASAAKAVIFHRLKFCDPEAFDHPDVSARLGQAGVPSLLIEDEQQMRATGAMVTRIQAFLETLL